MPFLNIEGSGFPYNYRISDSVEAKGLSIYSIKYRQPGHERGGMIPEGMHLQHARSFRKLTNQYMEGQILVAVSNSCRRSKWSMIRARYLGDSG